MTKIEYIMYQLIQSTNLCVSHSSYDLLSSIFADGHATLDVLWNDVAAAVFISCSG